MNDPSGTERNSPKPRLLYLVTEDWHFLSHRLPMAWAACVAGIDVYVATRVAAGAAAIEAEGFHLHPLNWRRGSTNPIDFLRAVAEVRRTYRDVAPISSIWRRCGRPSSARSPRSACRSSVWQR